MKDPKEEEHIEELLSQLQGIFGKLSKTEEEESRAKADLPDAPPPVSKPIFEFAPDPIPEPAPEPARQPAPEPPPAVVPAPEPEPKADPFALRPPPELALAPEPKDPMPEVTGVSNGATSTPVMPPPVTPIVLDASTIGCAIYYPAMREKEAKTLSQKIETMTPKFTKLAFKLQVLFIVSYDPRSDWRDAMIDRARQNNVRALFLATDRALEEPKRRALQTELDGYQIYFQEVPIAAIEKKAFFTDVLLGMVFFFDSLKPKPSGE